MDPSGRRVFQLHTPERDVDEEIAFHLAMREEKLREDGLVSESARALAIERFGDAAAVRKECLTIDRRHAREGRVMEIISSFAVDLRLAYRSLRKLPAFTVVATITLALGIGATSAMFSLVDGILLKPLPYATPERLVQVRQAYPEKGLDHWALSQENVAMYRDRVHQFESFGAYARGAATYTTGATSERLNTVRVTGDFFKVLGVSPALGRVIGRDDDSRGNTGVLVLSWALWQNRFGGDRAVLGRSIDLDGQPMRVIGVMPNGFAFPRPDAQVWMPLGLDATRRYGWFLTGIARLAPRATIADALKASTGVMQDWAGTMPGLVPSGVDARNTRMASTVVSLHDAVAGDSAKSLEVLQAAVVLMLLIAIANVATLVSSRTSARSRELSLRRALGATTGRAVRQLLTESLALAWLGGVAGIALAYCLVRVVTHSPAVSLPRLGEVSVSLRVLAFTAGVTIAAGVAFGLMPMLSLVRGQIAGAIDQGQKGSAHGSARRGNSVLVTAQLALSVVLLISAGLVLKSFRNLLGTDLGFEPTGVTTIALPLPAAKYTTDLAVSNATARLADLARAVAGVRDAAIATSFPFSGNTNSDGYLVDGRTEPAGAGLDAQTVLLSVGPGYFQTLEIPIKFGREFTDADLAGSAPVTIVNEALASRYWVGGDAIGKRIRTTGDTTWRTIVGVAGSVRDEDVATAPRPHSYFPFAQLPDPRPMLAVRTANDPAPVLTSVRRAIAAADPGIPLDNVRPLASWISRTLDTRRITEVLLVGFAALAAVLAAVGIYGVMALWVTNRYREFGIRLAIGAEPGNLLWLVLGQGMTLAGAGVVLGVGGAAFATRWLRSLLYAVSATDPAVYAGIAVSLAAIAFVSCWIPARRAARSDPLTALRAP